MFGGGKFETQYLWPCFFACENNVLRAVLELSELSKASSSEQNKDACCLHGTFNLIRGEIYVKMKLLSDIDVSSL